MAIEQVRNGINSFYQALASEAFSAGKSTSQYIREMQDKKFAFKITVGMDYADRMKEAVDQLSGEDFPIHQIQDAVRETINNFPTASEYKTDKAGIIHASIGKTSFTLEELRKNITFLLEEVKKKKPESSKGIFIKKFFINSTMGPGLQVDPTSVM